MVATEIEPTHEPIRWWLIGSIALILALLLASISVLVYWPQFSVWLTSPSGQALDVLALAVGAMIGGLGLVAAGAAVPAAFRQIRLQRQISELQSSRECLFRFEDEWWQKIKTPREDGSNYWTRANKALGSHSWFRNVHVQGFVGEFDHDVQVVLNFFEGIAYMNKRGDLDMELAWRAFGDIALEFHKSSRWYVEAYRWGLIKRTKEDQEPYDIDLTYWEDFDWWVGELKKLDTASKVRAYAAAQVAVQSPASSKTG